MSYFNSVILDVDSTVSAVEGIDWLAELHEPSVARIVAALTADAMDARVPLDEVYGRRLAIIRPTRSEIAALAAIYIARAMPGAREAISVWRDAGVHVIMVSGGLRDAILPLAGWLGVHAADVHAVDVEFDADDVTTGVRGDALLARAGGKPALVATLALARPVLAVGDGATDAELVPIVDRFFAFTGVVRRDPVVAVAAGEVESFARLTQIVLGA